VTVTVDIADRLYDYTDEECAADAIAEYQAQTGLDDSAIIALWEDERDPRYKDLYGRVVNAVDANGSVKRARDNIPAGITLAIA
jgi:hypothetical protein